MSADHTQRHAHEDARNEARLRALVAQAEEHENEIRRRTVARVVNVLVQTPDPHTYRSCPVSCNPRRPFDFLDLPGEASSDFEGCIA